MHFNHVLPFLLFPGPIFAFSQHYSEFENGIPDRENVAFVLPGLGGGA